MPEPPFWPRIKNARLFRVLAIYIAASWVILQVVGLFIETMDLPGWTMPWTLVLLFVGLVIVMATAWIQSHPLMPQREADDEVPDDWELDVGEIKESVTEGRLPHLNWARVILGGVLAFSLLFGLAGLYVVIQDRGESFSPEPAMAEAAPGIAVLPFTVQGEGLEVMREGMVSLLSTGLDGVAGLRAIDNRTVLARWDEHVPEASTADLATALEVARATRARYALIGSAVAVGAGVRLVADAYSVDTAEQLGTATAEGSADSLLTLVDRLAVDLLRVILQGREELPEINTASLTTDSPEALRAYLEGEIHHRHADFSAAIEAYERAVAADSTFALAQAQLGYAYVWTQRPEAGNKHIEKAAQLAHRLPKRDALLVRATLDEARRTTDSLESLQEAVRLQPDDGALWYRLAETYTHVRSAWATPEEVEQMFERAVELDPRNAEYMWHYAEFPWFLGPDSARAAERLERLARLAPDSPKVRGGRLALDLAFGDSVNQEEAQARLRSEDVGVIVEAAKLLLHPRNLTALTVPQEIYERGDEQQKWSWGLIPLINRTALWRGWAREGQSYLENQDLPDQWRAFFSYSLFADGFPIEEESLQAALAPAKVDSISHAGTILFVGAFAADRGRWPDWERARAELERRAGRAFEAADSTEGISLKGQELALEGYGLWRRGQPETALPLLESDMALSARRAAKWLAQLYVELGRFKDAERVYRSFDHWPYMSLNPLTQSELGKIYEALEEWEKALESYEYFVEYWNDADPELQPMVEEARQAIIRLRGLRRE